MTVQINGTTGIDQIQAGAVQQSDLAANVVGNGPCFSAYSVGHSVTPDVLTKVQFSQEEFDFGSAFDSVTNSRFQPTVPGYYQINATVAMQAVSGLARGYATAYKNGVNYRTGTYAAPIGLAVYSSVTCLVFLNGSSDYIEIYANANGSTPTIISGAVNTYFQGFLARSA